FVSQNGGNVCLRKTSPFFLVWLWHTRHTAWIDLRRRRAIVATERRHFAGACFHISRGDSVHATLRKPALNFCSRYEALATPRPLTAGSVRRSSPRDVVVFVLSVTFSEARPSSKQMNSRH